MPLRRQSDTVEKCDCCGHWPIGGYWFNRPLCWGCLWKAGVH